MQLFRRMHIHVHKRIIMVDDEEQKKSTVSDTNRWKEKQIDFLCIRDGSMSTAGTTVNRKRNSNFHYENMDTGRLHIPTKQHGQNKAND